MAFELHEFFDRASRTEPLNAALYIAANDVTKMRAPEQFVLGGGLAGKAQLQIDLHNMFSTARNRIEQCAEAAAESRDQAVGQASERAEQRNDERKTDVVQTCPLKQAA